MTNQDEHLASEQQIVLGGENLFLRSSRPGLSLSATNGLALGIS